MSPLRLRPTTMVAERRREGDTRPAYFIQISNQNGTVRDRLCLQSDETLTYLALARIAK